MTTTGVQRRQARPAHRHVLPVDAGDGPWTVSATEKPHDPASYTLNLQSPTRHLTLSRSAREIVELHSQLRDAYPGVPHPAFPLHSATSIIQRPLSLLASRASKSRGIRYDSWPSVATNPAPNSRISVEGPTSADTVNMALAWYLTALSNDPVFRQVPPWKNFVCVRTDDHDVLSMEHAVAVGRLSSDVYPSIPSSSSITTDLQRLSVLDRAMPHGIVHGPRGRGPSEDVSSVRVRDFEMVCVLGIGSKGKVLLARRKGPSGVYALKVIAKRRVLAYQEPEHTLTEQAVLRRMASEGTNSSVVKLLLSFHDEDNLYMALEFQPCGDLRTQLDRWRSFGHDLCRFYAAELVGALEGLHAAGVIHRNLKPEHILIDKDGHIVLCGFGKCKDFRSAATQTGSLGNKSTRGFPGGMNDAETTASLCGTAEYFAPEVIKGLPYSYAVDWWSLGTILYEMLTGNRPFDADNMSDMYDRILHDGLRFPDDPIIDHHTRNFIQKLLERDPTLRLAEPQIRRHHYFLMIDWSDVHYRQLRPPYIPPIDRSNPTDTQNFEDVYLKMKPVISDEFDADMEQEWARSDLDSIDDVDPIATPSPLHVSPAHPHEGVVDVFEGYSFKGQHSDVIGDEECVPVTDKPEEDTEAVAETIPGRDTQVPTEEGIPEAQSVALRLPVSSPPIEQRPAFPKPEPPNLQVDANANASASPTNNNTDGPLFVIPHITTQAPAPPTPPTTEPVLAGTAAASAATAVTAAFSRHLKVQPEVPKHKHKTSSHRLLPNVRRTRRSEKPGVSTLGNELPDSEDDEDSDTTRNSEGLDNGPRDLVKVESESANNNGPGSIKSMSKRSVSTTWSITSTTRTSSRSPER